MEYSPPPLFKQGAPARVKVTVFAFISILLLIVDGWQARNGSNTANARSITFHDGRRLFAGTSNQNAQEK